VSRWDVKKRRYEKVKAWCIANKALAKCEDASRLTFHALDLRMNARGYKRDGQGRIVPLEGMARARKVG